MRLPTVEELVSVDSERKTEFCKKLNINPKSLASVFAAIEGAPQNPVAMQAAKDIQALTERLEECHSYITTQLIMLKLGPDPTAWAPLLTDLCATMLQVGYNIGQAEALDLLAGIGESEPDK